MLGMQIATGGMLPDMLVLQEDQHTSNPVVIRSNPRWSYILDEQFTTYFKTTIPLLYYNGLGSSGTIVTS